MPATPFNSPAVLASGIARFFLQEALFVDGCYTYPVISEVYPWVVLQCFGQIQRADGVLTRQVGDGARSDSSPWHRALRARERAQELGFQLIPLPGYSPDLNPIEGLWKWLREEVTQHHSYQTMRDLFMACKDFIDRINLNPEALVQRLSPKFDLDPKFEKLLFS